MKSGYLYVLTHPSDPTLYKIGITIRPPEIRLAEHNYNFEKPAGKIVEVTGQEWSLKTYIAVPDPYWAEKAFWDATHFSLIPYRRGIEVQNMEWGLVQNGLEAAMRAGVRPGPDPLPDHVYAYTAGIRKRLEGRGITLLGYVRSVVSGKANFRCGNGHEWRTRPLEVGEGQGCPQCGMGLRAPEEVLASIGGGVICLLTHPAHPGFVKVGLVQGTLEQVSDHWPWGDWNVHRYRNVDELVLAESLLWELLGKPLPHAREPINVELKDAEEAVRKLIGAMREEIAFRERSSE